MSSLLRIITHYYFSLLRHYYVIITHYYNVITGNNDLIITYYYSYFGHLGRVGTEGAPCECRGVTKGGVAAEPKKKVSRRNNRRRAG